MTSKQLEFLKEEVWLLSFAGAFSRNSIYKKTTTEKERLRFRNELRAYIENVIHPAYKVFVTDEHHKGFIIALIEFSRSFSQLLLNNELSVGTAQKLLNLSLKYHWCLGLLNKPPHFPIDRIIQLKLPKHQRINWTDISTLEQYDTLIKNFRAICPKELSLAEWELENFNRRAS